MLAGARPRPTRLQAQSVVQMVLPKLSAAHEKQGLQAVKMFFYNNLPYLYTIPCQP
jgi:hypothetical protein